MNPLSHFLPELFGVSGRSSASRVDLATLFFFLMSSSGAVYWLSTVALESSLVTVSSVILNGVAVLTLIGLFSCLDFLLNPFFPSPLRSVCLSIATLLPLSVVVLDGLHYAFFREHLSRMTVETAYLAVTTGEVPFDTGWYLQCVLSVAGWMLFSILFYRTLRRIIPEREIERKRLFLLLFTLLLMLFGIDALRLTISLYRGEEVVPAAPYLPKYLTWEWLLRVRSPLKKGQLGENELSIFTEREQFMQLEAARNPLLEALPKASRTPHILLISVEGLRGDMLSPETMPTLSAEADRCLSEARCLVQRRHYSTGNNSGSGVFGMLTGLNGFYYETFRRQFSRPLPLQVLKEWGSQIGFYAETDWWCDDFFSLFFQRGADVVVHHRRMPRADLWRYERELLERYTEDLVHARAPRFDFFVWYSTHYNYFYPDEFAVFQPTLAAGFRITSSHFRHLERDAHKIRNRYKNSVRYFDEQLSRLFTRLRSTGRLEDTIVIITGDHGEEFWEHGRFGHTYGFSNEQTEVVFFAHFPGEVRSSYVISSHEDIFPTLFHFLDIPVQPDAFMTGKSLLDHHPNREWALVSKGIVMFQSELEHMIVSPSLKVRFRNEGVLRACGVTDSEDGVFESFPDAEVAELLGRVREAKRLRPR